MRKLFVGILVLLFLGIPCVVQAGLVWEDPVQEFWPQGDAIEQEIVYRFKNAGDEAVNIQSVKADCGCTVPTSVRSQYGPGETGEISAVFTFGQRQGRQKKKIVVKTDDPENPVQKLEFIVHIPDLVEMRPSLLLWHVGGAPEVKQFEVSLNSKESIELMDVYVKEGVPFEVTHSVVEEGKRYLVSVTPEQLDRKMTRSIYVRVKLQNEKIRVFSTYLLVKPE